MIDLSGYDFTDNYVESRLQGLGMAMRQQRQSAKVHNEQAKTIPIIAMTANAFSDDIHHSLTVGMNAHISKPVEMRYWKKQ